ncbi:hypothetical protein Acor_34880 [Acrocarpospora corrugata]|uniref:Uncharacterized protein n=1 Tax=Acrocarpospora corrugata TaxID=35763 RepID=A0A5M3VY99_9ACTN|nr:hypothetical protein [Acrocarpospora corrugata]GES01424.1 hypothetical protein Acor_34880 [Acrocarpospora corrugata]
MAIPGWLCGQCGSAAREWAQCPDCGASLVADHLPALRRRAPALRALAVTTLVGIVLVAALLMGY